MSLAEASKDAAASSKLVKLSESERKGVATHIANNADNLYTLHKREYGKIEPEVNLI